MLYFQSIQEKKCKKKNYHNNAKQNQDLFLSCPFSVLPSAAATAQTKAHSQHLPICMRQQTATCVSGCLAATCLHHPDL
jgi:hypothetical protein